MNPPVVRRPPTVAADDPRSFTIKSGRVRAIKEVSGGSERYFIEGTASSSVRDRHGDTLTDSAQLMMLDQCKDLTMWLNHSYKVPEDILGTCGESTLEKANDPAFGPCIDLNIRCEVYPNNPRAMDSWKAVEGGVKLAYSIGGYFTDVELDEDEEALAQYWFPCIVNGVELLEISLVGIPANPRAYTKGLDTGMLPYMLEGLRATVDAAGETPQAKIAFGKSLFGRKHMLECAHKPTCSNIKAAGSVFCEEHKGDAVVPPARKEGGGSGNDDDASTTLNPTNQLRCVEAMKSMKAAYGHGMCQDAASSIKNAHEQVKAMLPDDYPYPDDNDPSDIEAQNAAPEGHTCSADGGEIVVTLTADVTALRKQIDDAKAEVETLSSTATQRANEITEAEKRVDALKAEEKTLQTQIDKLKATPTGRQTANSGGSYNGAQPYREKTATVADAQRRLGAALAGNAVDDPAMRPA